MGSPTTLLPAVIGAISDSDNEIGGILITRLRGSHKHGRNDGILQTAHPTWLQSPVDVFVAGHVGMSVDILLSDSPTANEGKSFLISTVSTTKQVILQGLDGSTPAFVDGYVRWRFSTLKVETVYQFPDDDPLMRLYLAGERDPLFYAQVIATPGAQEFRGLGSQTRHQARRVSGSTHLFTDEALFTAAMVGRSVYFLGSAPRVITAYTSSREVTLSGAAAGANATIWIALKDYRTGYMELDHQDQDPIYDGSRSQSSLDRLRRSMLVDYADGTDLDAVGRNNAVGRPMGHLDETYRRLIKVLANGARQTITAIEDVLKAFFPAGGFTIYEDLANYPCVIFIGLPTAALGSDYSGRWFVGQAENVTSTTTTAITVGNTPTTVQGVRLQDTSIDLDMHTYPSSDGWTYQNEGETEGNTFSVSDEELVHDQSRGDANGGAYRRDIAELSTENTSISAWFKIATLTTLAGVPWKIGMELGGKEVVLLADDAHVYLGQYDETTYATYDVDLNDSLWHRLELRVENETTVRAIIDGTERLTLALSVFSASANTRATFGYTANAHNQNWLARWDNVLVSSSSRRNYYNLRRDDGVLATSSQHITSAAALWVSGDTGKLFRTYGLDNRNNGLWKATYVGTGEFHLDPLDPIGGLSVETVGGEHFVTCIDPRFRYEDITRTITISGSIHGNNGNVVVAEYISPRCLRVTRGSAFVAEGSLFWTFAVGFVTETAVRWELIEAGSVATATLTLRDALPETHTPVVVDYTTIPSGQVLQDETIVNNSTTRRWPAYLFDVDQAIKAVLDDVKAKGVIIRYNRPW